METFDVPEFVEKQIETLKQVLGNNKALVAISGGVDSTVSAVLAYKAIGDNLLCAFIDDNFMRLGEPEHVKTLLSGEPLSLPLVILNERRRFMEAIKGLADPEEKRKAFRESFYQTLKEHAKKNECKYLIQGTIRADIEETSEGIKTQHNILEQIGINPEKKYGLSVVEPLQTLYKYQVREVARYLQVPQELAERQPFPGPGLGIRVVGTVTSEKLDELKKATLIVEEQLESHNPSQYFAAIFSGEISKDLKALRKYAAKILELPETSIKVGTLTEKATGIMKGKRKLGTIITMDLTDPSDRLLTRDYAKMQKIQEYINQEYPEATRLLVNLDKKDTPGYIVAIRAVKSKDFLTAQSMHIPWITLQEAAVMILDSCLSVSRVYYDLTPKPPATIEYE